MRTALATALLSVSLLATPLASQTVTIGPGVTPPPGTTIAYNRNLGLPQGQTFVVPFGFPVLQELRWFPLISSNDFETATLTFELYLWNGTAPVGAPVASVPIEFMVDAASTPFTGSLALIEGQSYLAMMVGGADDYGIIGFDPFRGDIYADGSFVFFDGTDWQSTTGREGPYDAHFAATFAGTTVPEPSTVVLTAAGLVAVLGLVRRRGSHA